MGRWLRVLLGPLPATGLLLPFLWWLWTMVASRHEHGPLTWAVWLALLAGPLVLGSYYLVCLVRGTEGAA